MNIKSNFKPVVTIITMTLNAERFIRETLDSVANQDYPYIEYLVIDGGSIDQTLDIVKGYQGLDIKIISEPDRGTSDAMNKGFRMASGKYVWALNADDGLAHVDTISRLVHYLEANPFCDFVFGNMVMVNETGETIGCRCFHDHYGFKDLLCDRRHLPFAGCLLRKSALERIGGGLDESLLYCNDLDFLLRVSHYGRMDYIPENTGIFRLHNRSSTSSNIKETGQESFAVCLTYLDFMDKDKAIGGEKEKIKALIYLHAASVCFHSGHPSEVRAYIKEAIRLHPFLLISVKPFLYFIASILGHKTMAAIAETTRRLIHKKYWYKLNN